MARATSNASAEKRPLIVYVHGLGAKPAPKTLKVTWDRALFGVDMGDRTRMAYWADILHPEEARSSDPDGLLAETATMPAFAPHAARVASKRGVDRKALVEAILPEMTRDHEQHRFAQTMLDRLVERASQQGAVRRGSIVTASVTPKIIPLPDWLRQPLARAFLRQFVRDAYEYTANTEAREAIQQRLLPILATIDRPTVLVGHSLGSVIAYDVLRRLEKGDMASSILRFVTAGSPLGIEEIKDSLAKPPTMPRNAPRWGNFADRLDIVALDQELHDDFKKTPDNERNIEDESVENPERSPLSITSPHSITGYLKTKALRDYVWSVLPSDFASTNTKFVVARDVATAMADPRDVQSVLIELASVEESNLLAKAHEIVQGRLDALAKKRPKNAPLKSERLRRYVMADLFSTEIDDLAARFEGMRVARIWANGVKRALIARSTQAIQVAPARETYGAAGKGIAWAVLDTGIFARHTHFRNTALHLFDATEGKGVRALSPFKKDQKQTFARDEYGHGTHVAGIIAGRAAKQPELCGMAPEADLYVYKVLDDQGDGSDGWIIKALDHIYALNESASRLVIHGVNLSLGGPFNAEVFACGHSPICRELRRLWQQGVVVCVAAGNEGVVAVTSDDGPVELSMDLSIGDPANLDEAIAVGSVHKTDPTIYGVSYFSSRGPTADGRAKPDVIAPGEWITSCDNRTNGYIDESGTSMACPHVSGLIAAFLSVRREYIGYPDRVKAILMRHARDLGRDRYHQGAGIPNLMAMLGNA